MNQLYDYRDLRHATVSLNNWTSAVASEFYIICLRLLQDVQLSICYCGVFPFFLFVLYVACYRKVFGVCMHILFVSNVYSLKCFLLVFQMKAGKRR